MHLPVIAATVAYAIEEGLILLRRVDRGNRGLVLVGEAEGEDVHVVANVRRHAQARANDQRAHFVMVEHPAGGDICNACTAMLVANGAQYSQE